MKCGSETPFAELAAFHAAYERPEPFGESDEEIMAH